jgi:hypothetical protein
MEQIELTLSISICLAMASPVVGPRPGTVLKTPSGNPASLMRSHKTIAVKGVNSEGFMTIVHPAARAGATFHPHIWAG